MEATYLRRSAVVVGVLFWVSNLVTLVGGVISGMVPGASAALTDMYPHATSVVVGTLIAHINEPAIIGYGIVLFIVLAPFSRGLATAYLAFKVVEAVLLLFGAAMLLSLIALSQSYLAGGASDAASYRATAEVTLSQQFWAGRLSALAYVIATTILNVVLYRNRMLPRPISVFGLVSVAMLAFGLAIGVGDPTHGFQLGQLLVIPIILWELSFATWLIVRGFGPAAVQDRLGVSDGRRADAAIPSAAGPAGTGPARGARAAEAR